MCLCFSLSFLPLNGGRVSDRLSQFASPCDPHPIRPGHCASWFLAERAELFSPPTPNTHTPSHNRNHAPTSSPTDTPALPYHHHHHHQPHHPPSTKRLGYAPLIPNARAPTLSGSLLARRQPHYIDLSFLSISMGPRQCRFRAEHIRQITWA